MKKIKAILLWSADDGALYHPGNVDEPRDPDEWREIAITLEDGKVSLSLDDIAQQENDISEILVRAGKAKFL